MPKSENKKDLGQVLKIYKNLKQPNSRGFNEAQPTGFYFRLRAQ